MKIRYFDHAATTQVKQEVLKEMLPYFELEYGNPSSIYGIGREAKRSIEKARERIAKAMNAKSKEIYFTSGGTESDNLALKGICKANKNKKKHIITTKIEHPAILETCHTLEKDGYEITYLNIDKDGIISLEELRNSIREDTILVSVMFANNEIGTLQPIYEIGKICREKNIIFHSDCVQAVGNIEIDVEKMNIDLLSISGHKFYGPKGIGALYVREGVEFKRIQDGGHQEKDKRSGTENVAAIVGMGKAIELAQVNFKMHTEKIEKLRNYCIEQIRNKIENVKINGSLEKRLPGNINVAFKGIRADELVLKLDEYGICVSAGSACSSKSNKPSHVLLALGLDKELAYSSLRITLGEENTKEDVDFLIEKIIQIIPNLKQHSYE